MAKRGTSNMPYIDNYPPLKAWLTEHGARCNWQIPLGDGPNPQAYVESWQVAGREALIVVHANRRGWNIYTPCDSNAIGATLLDASARLGVA